MRRTEEGAERGSRRQVVHSVAGAVDHIHRPVQLEVTHVHTNVGDAKAQPHRFLLCGAQHVLGQIDARHSIAHTGQPNRQRAGAAGAIRNRKRHGSGRCPDEGVQSACPAVIIHIVHHGVIVCRKCGITRVHRRNPPHFFCLSFYTLSETDATKNGAHDR